MLMSYQRILDSLSDGLEAQDCTAYQWATSDSWKRSRNMGPIDSDFEHLEFRFDLGNGNIQGRAGLRHDACTLEYVTRATADDSCTSQGRILDSARAAMDFLTGWGLPDIAARTMPDGFAVVSANGEYSTVRITFHLHITNWRA
jgi:hypothetical protein